MRIDTAFVGLLEHFASEDVDRTVAVNSQTVLAVWEASLKVQRDSQTAAVTAAKAVAAFGAAAGTSMQMDDDDAAINPPAKAAEGSAAAKPDANSFAAVNALTYGVSDTRLDLDAGHNATAKASCIIRILADPSINDDQKEKEIATLYQCWGTQPHTVSSLRSSSRSDPPEPFHGLAKDHGQPAQSWLYSVNLYFQAEYTPNPVAKVAKIISQYHVLSIP